MRSTRWCITACLAAMAVAVPMPSSRGTSTAHADTEPGSGFAFYRMSANAPTLGVTEDNTKAVAHPEAEGDLMEAVSSLGSTGGSYALSSAAWPGALAGNLGTLLIGANPSVPTQAAVLDDPVRAEAKNNGGTVTNETYPGMTMTATSHPDSSSASTHLIGAEAAVVSVGNTSATSNTKLTGVASARATATGVLHDLALAGVVKIGSVLSTAAVVSDGRKATGTGSTTVSGATVAGVPVAIDDMGVHVATTHELIPGQAQQTVNTALTQLGMSMRLIGSTTTSKAGMVRFVAGSLIVVWMPPPSPGQADTHETIVLAVGGASAAVDAAPGYSGPQVGPPLDPYQPPSVVVPPGPQGGGQVPTIPGSSVPPSIAPSGNAPVTAPVTTAASQLPALPSPLGVAWLLAGTAIGAAVGLGLLRRLPTSFAAAAGSTCPWEVSS